MKVALADADDSPTHASYPHFDARYLRAIELAIRQAWAHLLADPTEASRLATNTEVQISHQLRAALNGIREGRIESTTGYNCNTFERPQLGAEVLTSAHAIRKPDLTFSLAGPPRPGVDDGMEDAIFVECKLIEQGKGVADYCNDGLRRFVDGDYCLGSQFAWTRLDCFCVSLSSTPPSS